LENKEQADPSDGTPVLTMEEEHEMMESEDDMMMDSDDKKSESGESEEPEDADTSEVSLVCHEKLLQKVWKMTAPHAEDGKGRERKIVFKEVKAPQTKMPGETEEVDAKNIVRHMHAQDMTRMIETLQNGGIKRLRLGDVGKIPNKAWLAFRAKCQDLTFAMHAFSTDDARQGELAKMGCKFQGNVDAQEQGLEDSAKEDGQQQVTEVMKESFHDASAGRRLKSILECLKRPRSKTWASHLGDTSGLSEEDWRALAEATCTRCETCHDRGRLSNDIFLVTKTNGTFAEWIQRITQNDIFGRYVVRFSHVGATQEDTQVLKH